MPSVRSRTVDFETPWFQVISKTVKGMPEPAGKSPFYAIKPEDYVSVLAVTKENKVLLVRQFRPVTEDYTLELPSGHISKDEDPETAIKRELLEETGYRAANVELLGCLVPDTGRLLNKLWCYFTNEVVRETTETEEGITLKECSFSELKELVIKSQLTHALNLALITLAVTKNKLPSF